MPVFFAVTLFVSALLLFLVQPMVGKMILPKFGGAPAVWNTCMVFYQAALLAGYLYAHASTTWLGVRRQAALHLGLLLLPVLALTLPIQVSGAWAAPPEANPIPWVLGLLLTSVGLPFFVVSSSAPLLQKWFANTGHASAADPYYLYSASNLGSMLALLGYPFLIEPYFRLPTQGWLWAVGYGLLVVLTLGCAVAVWRSPSSAAGFKGRLPAPQPEDGETLSRRVTWKTRLRWVAVAFVPSSLMLGVTTYLSTDLSPFPLLWVIPLALYLLSFILVFARIPPWVHRCMSLTLPVVILLQAFLMISSLVQSMRVLVPLHLLTLFVASMVCHGELARTRPAAQRLTEFYLWMSFGGVLGGLFNALLAPLVFNSVAEYPIAMVLACLLMPTLHPERSRPWSRLLDFALPILLTGFALRFAFQWDEQTSTPFLDWANEQLQPSPGVGKIKGTLQWGVPLLISYLFFPRPLRFGLAVGLLYLASTLHTSYVVKYVFQERSFFGVLRIESADEGQVAKLSHGSTLHGAQIRSENRIVRMMPLLYYFPTGPIGQVFQSMHEQKQYPPVAAIGLGAGTLAAYGQPDQEFDFFDIDPMVERIARDQQFFTYFSESYARCQVILGDARLRMAEQPDGRYGLIIVDAFSSDAIPVHLVTREALQVYLQKLAPGGIIAFHVSNKYLELEPVMAGLAQAEGLATLTQYESQGTTNEQEALRGKLISDWVIMARQEKDFGKIATDSRWRPTRGRPDVPVWTDDFSNVLSVLKWK